MKLTLSQLSEIEGPHAEFCVIGSGPAGMTIAMELAAAGRKVLMLEAGDEDYSDRSQEVYQGEIVGDPYFPLDTARLRTLGGSSGHWGGWCRPMDALDFGPKPNFAHAHWPIDLSAIEPYFARMSEILGLGALPQDDVLDEEIGFAQTYFFFSDVRFADKYRAHLDASENLTYVTGANVTLLETDGSRITRLKVQGYEGEEMHVEANQYVLATGGIENSRILLWSNQVQNGAIAPNSLPIGKYWMEHPTFEIGEAILRADFPRFNFFRLTEEKQRELGVLNCGLRLFEANANPNLWKRLACVSPGLGRTLAGPDFTCGWHVGASWEQEPVADNRVPLSSTEVDKFGMPRSVLHWRKTQRDLETVRKSAIVMGQYMAEHDLGRLRLKEWVLGEEDYPEDGELAGYHHMGGTRMADNPHEGVVDENCRMYGQENLYIAGSSVFPSGGYANPTVTIVQLALRLADQIPTL